jgi:pyridinium-3,5-biscarboxylic acid mononucleotide sulfurtransferase
MSAVLDRKLDLLRAILSEMGSAVVAYSGGADSALVLSVAHEVLGERCVAFTGDSASLDGEELDAARRTAAAIGARHVVVATMEMDDPRYLRNSPDRCYWCKSELHARTTAWAAEHGFAWVADGLNADDDPRDRPGVRAAAERGVRSPLREAGVAKAEVRELSRRRGLATWDKPAAPCLSSRLPHGTPVTAERLREVGDAERALRALGFRELRVRHHGELARIEIPAAEIVRAAAMREEIVAALAAAGFRWVTLDLAGLRSGGASGVPGARAVLVPSGGDGAAAGEASA